MTRWIDEAITDIEAVYETIENIDIEQLTDEDIEKLKLILHMAISIINKTHEIIFKYRRR